MSEDPFLSSKRRLKRSKSHIERLEKRLIKFMKTVPYTHVVELDADGVTKLHKLKARKPIPESVTDAATESVEALRSVLDQAGYASAVASGFSSPKKTAFPIGDDAEGLANVIKRKGSSHLPTEILDLFCAFKPYKGGNDAIWALNQLCNTNKHAVLAPVGTFGGGMTIRHGVLSGDVAILTPRWDRVKNEMVLARVGPTGDLDYQGEATVGIAFENIDVIGGQPASIVLKIIYSEVKRILMATEAECRRLGFTK